LTTIQLTLLALCFESTFIQGIHADILPPCVHHDADTTVRYIHLTEVKDQYSMGIFVFPPNAHIPLHDHPGMCVLSRVLYGTVRRLSLDLQQQPQPQQSSSLAASLQQRLSSNNTTINKQRAICRHVDHLVAPDTTILYPLDGNLHEFHAGPHGAAVLDVLVPPYSVKDDRDCTFYAIQEDEPPGKQCWIVPTGQPESFHCISGRYNDLGNV
jgi:predicted metal-dependent enzyme (double-stranded beta helix superfamily)